MVSRKQAAERKATSNRRRYHDESTGYKAYQAEANRRYYQENREKLLAAQRAWNARHKTHIRKYKRKYMRKRNNRDV